MKLNLRERTGRNLRAGGRVVLSTALLLGLALPATGQEDDESSWSGRFVLGLRTVSTDGREEKYRQQVNLDDGVSLFSFEIESQLSGDFADQLRIRLDGVGGEPYESMGLSLRKFGSYKFEFDRRESEYFYDDLVLPQALATPSLSDAGDFHTFDFRRVHDSAHLEITVNPQAKFDLSFDRHGRRGESTTTLDIQRDEFELDRPIDERMDELAAAFQYSWDKVTLFVEERYRDFENFQEIFAPGRSLGEDPDDATILDFFFLDQPYDFESFQHAARLNFRPDERVIVTVSGSLQSLDLESDVGERSAGTDFRGLPFETLVTGAADIDRDVELFEADLSYLVSPRVAFVAAVRLHQLDQEGTSSLVEGASARSGLGTWDVETTGFEVGVEIAALPELNVSVGVLQEARDVEFVTLEASSDVLVLPEAESEETDNTGTFLRLDWRPSKRLRLDLAFEDDSFDDPFTTASPTDRERIRLQGRLTLDNGVYVRGTYLMQEVENSLSGWQADYDSLNLRGGYRVAGLDVSLGYSSVDAERAIDQQVVTSPGFMGGIAFLFPVFFESTADFIDARALWSTDGGTRFGGDFRFYENDGDFPLERDDFRIFAEISLPRSYLLHLSYRSIDYQETVFGFNDYDADIGEVGIGYRW